MQQFVKDTQYYKFCMYVFFKNLRFFEPFLILFFLDKGLTYLEIGTLYAIREILINVMEIPSGIFADALGRKSSLMISFLFYILSFIIFYFTLSFPVFVIAILFYALGDAFRTGTHKAMIFDYLKIKNWKNQRANYYGHTRSWSQFGSAISSLMAAFIVFYSGNYKSIFLYSVIPYIIDFILIASYPKKLNGSNVEIKKSDLKSRLLQIGKDYLKSFKNIKVIRAIANLSVHSGFHKSIKDFLQPVIHSFALSIPVMFAFSENQKIAVLIGIFYFVLYLLSSFTSRKAGQLKDKLKSSGLALNITMYTGFFLAFLSGFFYQNEFYFLSIVFYIGIYLIENLRNPIGVAFVSELYKDEILATALSANSQFKSLMAAVVAPILGLLADMLGLGKGLLIIAIGLFLSSFLFYIKKKV